MSSSGSRSPSKGRSKSREKLERVDKHKLFVTNLDGKANEIELKADLTQLFKKYGALANVTVKKSKNGEYCFAFVEYQRGENGEEAVQKLNGTQNNGKSMKVQLQDDSKRRKDSDIGCYTCGKKGHFARECRSGRDSRRDGHRGYRDRSRSSSRSNDRHRKRKHRRRSSDSSERSRSRTKHKKDKSKKRKDHKSEKKEKKSKKSRRRSSSMSES